MTTIYLPNDKRLPFVCPHCGGNELVEGAHDCGVDWPDSYLDVDLIAYDGEVFQVDYVGEDPCHSFSSDEQNPGCTEIWYSCAKCEFSWESNGPEDPSEAYWDSIAHQLKAVDLADDSGGLDKK